MRSVWVGKRQASRNACLIKAEIRTGDDKPIGPCSIVDMSKSGARAKLTEEFDIPEMFALFIPARNETRVCKLRWNRDGEIGIEFIAIEQITTYEAVVKLELRLKAIEALLKTGDPALSIVNPSPATQGDGTSGPLETRFHALEGDVSRTVELVQNQIDDSLKLNLVGRISQLETQNREILDTLRALMPMLASRAS